MRKNRFILDGTILLLLLLLTGAVVHAQEATATPLLKSNIVILVVDDFTPKTEADIAGEVSKNDNIVRSGEDPTLCYFNPLTHIEGQAMADGMGGAVVDASGKRISHGDLVFAQTLGMINQVLASNPFPDVTITAVPVSVKDYVISSITA